MDVTESPSPAVGPCPIPATSLSPAAQKATDPNTPIPARMMAARGLAPMAPRDLVTVQFVLTFDADAQVRDAATASLAKLDDRIANAVFSDTAVDPNVLAYLAVVHADRDAFVEKLLLNSSMPASAFVTLAERGSSHVAEIIANNQARLLEQPEIARSLVHNARALRSTIDRVVDFLVRSGIVLDGVAEFEQALLRLGASDRLLAANQVELPAEFVDPALLNDAEKAELGGRRMIAEDEEILGDEVKETENTRKFVTNWDVWMRNASLGAKVALATKGNKFARSRLLRESNRVVAMAAITSPAITEPEVVAAAQSRVVHQDVVGYIAKQKDYVKNYPVKVALVNNPKCPAPEAMKLVPSLQKKDLRVLSASRNVSAAVRNQAMQLIKTRLGE